MKTLALLVIRVLTTLAQRWVEEMPVILYCFKSARTSNTFIALKEASIKDVRTYFGSWNEWSRDETPPIEEGYPQRVGYEIA